MTHHRMTRHRMFRHRMTAEMRKSLACSSQPDRKHWEHNFSFHNFTQDLLGSTPKPLVRRELRPPLKGRCVNQLSSEPHHHSQRKHRRGKRSFTQQLIHLCNRRQKRSMHRREFRRVRSCWKALAGHPTKLSKAQERVLAETQPLEQAHSILNSDDAQENGKDKPPQPPNPFKLLGKRFRLGVFNVRGMNFISARQQIVFLMNKHKIDILALLETHINYTGKETHGDFNFYFSSSVEDDCRKQSEEAIEEYNRRVKKEKISFAVAQAERMRIRQRSAEKLGCAFVVRKQPGLDIDVSACNNKNISLRINTSPIAINIAATHAPHAGHSTQQKTKHYEELALQLSKLKKHEINIILGDFNARLMEQLPEESQVIGKHIYRQASSSIADLSESQRENRQLFSEFCISHRMIPLNTWFEKPSPLLATFRDSSTDFFQLGWIDTSTHGQLDYVLVNHKWRNSFTDVNCIHETLLNSDHALVLADVHVRFAATCKTQSRTLIAPRFRLPSEGENQRFNRLVQQNIEKAKLLGVWNAAEGFERFAGILIEAACASLPRISPRQKKHYLSEQTWQKIEEKEVAIGAGHWNAAKQLTVEIRKLARRDKDRALVEELERIDRDGYQWEGLKKCRSTFQPKRYKFRNKHGDLISEHDFAETAAEYFADVQWAVPEENQPDPQKEESPLLEGQNHMVDSPFTIAELDAVLAALKNNKSPGPDGCRSELVKWLGGSNRVSLLELYNDILLGVFPECFCLANIAACYKKGDATQMKNYRPIALLQVFYKILASLVRSRFQRTFEPWIQRTQFGFRPRKSTAQAIFIARRLLDIAERQHTNITVVLLDWEKAFDKISHCKLLQVLRRLKTPPNMLHLVSMMYHNPRFRITAAGTTSNFKRQHSGIRQGCPLSPYLFVLLMSALFCDVKARLVTPKQKEPIPGIRFAEVLYADDTLLFGTHTHTINKLLHEIQRESAYYNLKLNFDKCINLTLHQRQSSIKYLDGTPVPRKKDAIYLGTLLSDNVNNHREVTNRLAAATATCNRMKLFWDKANNTIRWKIRVFESILRSKVLYGLECIQLTQPDLDKLNAFQLKNLRRILKIPPAFIDRSYSNQRVLDMIRDIHHISIELFSQIWLKRKLKLFGHILRSSPDDPMRQVLFEYNSFLPRFEYRRPGRPRTDWLLQSFKDAFELLGRVEGFDPNLSEHTQFIVQNAITRQGIFA